MKIIITYLLIILFANLAFALPSPKSTPTTPLNGIAAIVNNAVITKHQLQTAVSQLKSQFQHQGIPLPDAESLQQQVLQELIYQKIQLHMAKNAGISVSADEINQAIDRIASGNHLSRSAFLNKLSTAQGLSIEAIRHKIKDQLIISKLQRSAIMPTIQLSNSEVNQAYQQALNQGDHATEYNVSDLLIPLSSDPSSKAVQAANQQARTLLKKLKQGADFKSLARASSSDNNTLSGGSLGWRKLAELPDMFANVIIKMKPQQVSQPIRAPNGIHLLKLNGIRHAKDQITKDEVKNMLLQKKFQQKLSSWLTKLQNQAYVKILV